MTVPAPAGSPPAATPATVATVSQPGASTRVGNGAGGCLGADGVNVETKHAYIWLDTGQWVPGSRSRSVSRTRLHERPFGAVFDDDGAGIKVNMKFDPVDVELYMAKIGEGQYPNANADDTDMYVGARGHQRHEGHPGHLEGMLVDERVARRLEPR